MLINIIIYSTAANIPITTLFIFCLNQADIIIYYYTQVFYILSLSSSVLYYSYIKNLYLHLINIIQYLFYNKYNK